MATQLQTAPATRLNAQSLPTGASDRSIGQCRTVQPRSGSDAVWHLDE